MLRRRVGRLLYPPVPPRPGSGKWLGLFAVKYSIGLAASLFLFAAGIARKRHRMLLNHILTHFGFAPDRPVPELPSVAVGDVVAAATPVVLPEPAARDGNVTLHELLVIAQLVAARDPAAIFEIGTFDGRTTLALAANSSGRVFTLDLPADEAGTTRLALDPGDVAYIAKPRSGERFLRRPEARRITQLFGDSATFDFSSWHGSIDLVFIDGAHSREYVLSDTERALRLLRPTGGVVLWHDYDASFSGVTEALHELARRGLSLRRIADTSLALLVVGEGRR